MAHELTQTDAVIMFSGVLLAVSFITLSGNEGFPRGNFGLRRMIGYIFLNLGRAFWTVWFLLCLLIFTGGLVLKFKYHREYPWKAGGGSFRHQFERAFRAR